MLPSELEVYLCDDFVGHLVTSMGGEWSFVYAAGVLADESAALPVSLTMLHRNTRYRGDAVYSLFSNLLPEGELRRRIAQSVGLSENNGFALLARIAGDCPGGLSFRLPGAHAPAYGSVRELNDTELRNLMAVLPAHPLLAQADDLRVSLPGEHDKLPVVMRDDRVALALYGGATTHILKPARPGLRESVLNEAYCMSLAAAFGLPVASCRVIHGLVAVLSVERFDRLQVGDRVTRIHMEDFCQLSGLPPARKYEREGGARLSDVGALLRRFSARPALDLRALIRWTIFNFLVGFGAGHTKQIAMLYGADGPRLSPFFGIWSTHVYPELSSRLALTVGREDRPDWLLAARWQQLAEDLGVGPRYVLLEVRDSAATLPRLAAEVAEQFQRRNGFAAIVRRIRSLIEQRSRQALVSLEAEGVSL